MHKKFIFLITLAAYIISFGHGHAEATAPKQCAAEFPKLESQYMNTCFARMKDKFYGPPSYTPSYAYFQCTSALYSSLIIKLTRDCIDKPKPAIICSQCHINVKHDCKQPYASKERYECKTKFYEEKYRCLLTCLNSQS